MAVTYEAVDTLSRHLGVPSDALLKAVRIDLAGSDANYRTFEMRKRSGGTREIMAPTKRSLWIQRRILAQILRGAPIDRHATAYSAGLSVVKNARQHLNSEILIRIDLADFFDSIGFEKVAAVYSQLGWDFDCAETLAYLTTVGVEPSRYLPQGSPTSPALSNLVARPMDLRLGSLPGIRYTRYSDDLTFSCASDLDHARIRRLIDLVTYEAESHGFRVNPKKTRIMPRSQRQVVTGVVINGDSPKVSRQDMKRFRALLHQCERRGIQTVSQEIGRNALAYAEGYLSYVHMINPEQATAIWQWHQWLRRPGE